MTDPSVETQRSKQFPPHPGKIVFGYQWNRTQEVKDAGSVPDEIKFVYYDAGGAETSDLAKAVHRVPVLEILTTSVDAEGKPVEPKRATLIEITAFGPDHRFLRHTTARVPPHS